ncbi:MAG TPA: YceI family protein [Thermomicrobiales bacterium]|nr:YceI family protein [Thermomicrobiales bacterium]
MIAATPPRNRPRPLLLALALAAISGLASGGGSVVVAQEATPGVLAEAPAAISCGDAGTPGTPGASAATPAPAAETFTVVGADSAARYRAQEELAGRGANEAVGQTDAIIGAVLFDAAGKPMPCSRFAVDLRTLKSDEARRDNYLYKNTLETEKYPLAVFIVTRVEGLATPLPDGKPLAFKMIGNLTMHGQTKAVVWDATAMMKGDELTGSAHTTFTMDQFNIEPPTVGPVLSIDPTVQLEIDLTARKAAA